jgi:hypothetical protein
VYETAEQQTLVPPSRSPKYIANPLCYIIIKTCCDMSLTYHQYMSFGVDMNHL